MRKIEDFSYAIGALATIAMFMAAGMIMFLVWCFFMNAR